MRPVEVLIEQTKSDILKDKECAEAFMSNEHAEKLAMELGMEMKLKSVRLIVFWHYLIAKMKNRRIAFHYNRIYNQNHNENYVSKLINNANDKYRKIKRDRA